MKKLFFLFIFIFTLNLSFSQFLSKDKVYLDLGFSESVGVTNTFGKVNFTNNGVLLNSNNELEFGNNIDFDNFYLDKSKGYSISLFFNISTTSCCTHFFKDNTYAFRKHVPSINDNKLGYYDQRDNYWHFIQPINTDTWYHVVVTSDNKFYVNGVYKGYYHAKNLNIDLLDYTSNSKLKNVLIYEKAFSDDEVSFLYNLGKGRKLKELFGPFVSSFNDIYYSRNITLAVHFNNNSDFFYSLNDIKNISLDTQNFLNQNIKIQNLNKGNYTFKLYLNSSLFYQKEFQIVPAYFFKFKDKKRNILLKNYSINNFFSNDEEISFFYDEISDELNFSKEYYVSQSFELNKTILNQNLTYEVSPVDLVLEFLDLENKSKLKNLNLQVKKDSLKILLLKNIF